MSESSLPNSVPGGTPSYVTAVVLGLLSSAVLGLVSGWLAGQTGPDATVVAALLPVVISAGGMLFFLWRTGGRADNKTRAFISVCLITFSIALACGAHAGKWDRRNTLDSEADKAITLELNRKLAYLEHCTDWEDYINTRRADLNLPPLPSEMFCRPQ